MRLPWTMPLGDRLARQLIDHRLWEEARYYGRARKAAPTNGRKTNTTMLELLMTSLLLGCIGSVGATVFIFAYQVLTR